MSWTIRITGRARKQIKKLPERISAVMELLIKDIENNGPIRNEWPNYGKLKGKSGYYHCHLNKGRPRYVAVWRHTKDNVELVEIRYVGTHEKADYGRID
jgi:mRNA-degrading endonuclease RelE of RelBE toxin-antitoxin system